MHPLKRRKGRSILFNRQALPILIQYLPIFAALEKATMKQKKLLFILIIFPLSILLSSWGWVGHQKISFSILDCFTEEMSQFEDWVPFLKTHASDADSRKGSDPLEGPKHYIDIDAYPEFLENGAIPTSLDSCITLHGADFVDDQGSLPWATLNQIDINLF